MLHSSRVVTRTVRKKRRARAATTLQANIDTAAVAQGNNQPATRPHASRDTRRTCDPPKPPETGTPSDPCPNQDRTHIVHWRNAARLCLASRAYSHPPGGGLRLIVPWPSGMRAVGLGLAPDLPLLERMRAAARGVEGRDVDGSEGGDGVVGELAATEPAGVTGFMRRPLRMPGAGRGDCARGDAARGD